MKSADASGRRNAIREILGGANEIASQEELQQQLEARGFKVTQSSISRDLRALGILKVSGRYVPSGALAAGADELQALAHAVRHVRPAGPNLLIVRTPPGQASAVGFAIDHAAWPEVVGTVAGDDTVFVAVRSRGDQSVVEARLSALA